MRPLLLTMEAFGSYGRRTAMSPYQFVTLCAGLVAGERLPVLRCGGVTLFLLSRLAGECLLVESHDTCDQRGIIDRFGLVFCAQSCGNSQQEGKGFGPGQSVRREAVGLLETDDCFFGHRPEFSIGVSGQVAEIDQRLLEQADVFPF